MSSGFMAPAEYGDWSPPFDEEEEEYWRPNPYQAVADAHVLAVQMNCSGDCCPMNSGKMQEVMPFGCTFPDTWSGMVILANQEGCILGNDTPCMSPANSPDFGHMQSNGFHMAMQSVEPHLAGLFPLTPTMTSAVTPTVTSAGTPEMTPDGSPCRPEDSSQWSFGLEPSCPEACTATVPSLAPADSCEQAADSDSSGSPTSLNQADKASEAARGSRKLSHQRVPKNIDFEKSYGEPEKDNKDITTVMVRNIPNAYTRSMLMEELDKTGFEGEYDFVYLPIDKSTSWNIGYAFVNFTSSSTASRCMTEMNNYAFHCFEHRSGKVAQICVAHIQGLEKNLEYYSNTAVLCAGNPTHRPLVLPAGRRQDGWEMPRKVHPRRRQARARPSLH